MKHKSRALAILLALAMVLTLMPAMAFAASVTTKYPAKIEYKGNTFYTPAGVDGDDFFDGYWKEGNEIIITYNDNTQETFVSKEYSNGFNYFRKGDEAKDENIVYDFRCAIKSPGIFTVDCGFEYNYQNEDGIIIPGQRTVSTEVEGVCIKSFEYTGGPKLEYEVDKDTGHTKGFRWTRLSCQCRIFPF